MSDTLHLDLFDAIPPLGLLLALAVALALAVPPLRRGLLRLTLRLLGMGNRPLMERSIRALGPVIIVAAWFFVLAAAAHFAAPLVPQWLDRLLLAVAFLAAAHLVVQILNLWLYRVYLQERRNITLSPLMEGVITAVVYLVAGLAVFENVLGINVLPFLATSTVITLVLGLALQDTLSNVFAGVSLTLERSFKAGDCIQLRIDAMNVREGEVLEIGWRSTRLRTTANTYVTIPNNQVSRYELTNLSAPSPLVARTLEIPIKSRVSPATALSRLLDTVCACPGVERKPDPEVALTKMASPENTFLVRFAVAHPERREEVTTELLASIWRTVEDLEGAEETTSPPSGQHATGASTAAAR